MSDVDEENLPDAATCQARCAEFAAVTDTDEACAQFFLQDHDWDVQRSLNSYFEARTSGAGVHVVPGRDTDTAILSVSEETVNEMSQKRKRRGSGDDVITVNDSDSDSDDADSAAPQLTLNTPKKFSLISWNLDGLDSHNLKLRTKAVVKIIEAEAPDMVLLQELIPPTCTYLTTRLPQYHLVAGGTEDYFTATLLRKYRVYYDHHEVIPYEETLMGRNLLSVQCHIGPLKLTLLNTHLESTAEHAATRQQQLRIVFKALQQTPADRVPLLAGDLNLRDSDVSAVGGLPAGVDDLWEACGRRKEVEYTWDTRRNTNRQMPSAYKPRLRFDRVYLRRSPQLQPQHFGLVGLEKVTGTQSFPSDHWGVQVYFNIT